MIKCWANVLGDCSDKVSREHQVSKGLFSSQTAVIVHGLPWCRDEPKTVGLESMTAKILCTTHNSALSPLDSEAQKFMLAVTETSKMQHELTKRHAIPERIVRNEVQAPLLERWLLKTLINLTLGSPHRLSRAGTEPGVPTDAMVRAAFGLEPLQEGWGLFMAAHTGQTFKIGETMSFTPVIEEGCVVGAMFELASFKMYLSIDQEGSNFSLANVKGIADHWAPSMLMRKFNNMSAKVGPYTCARLYFIW